jgi:5'-methylthioadenosine phosphorylase
MAIIKQNVSLAKAIVKGSVERIVERRTCGCQSAAEHAVMTAPDAIPAAARERLAIIMNKYWSK